MQSLNEIHLEPTQIVCPYLSTIKRHLLDFDFEKICSISMATNNVYGCLVCGRYFQGKSITSPAYEHSIQYSHFVFINLSNAKIYCLPENYEVLSHTVSDIKFNLDPQYSVKDLQKLYNYEMQYNVEGKEYIPGIIGFNNLKCTDYANAVFQILNAIQPIREHFLLRKQFADPLLDRFSIFIRRIWNSKQFKGSISPHQLMQIINQKSQKVYKIGKKSDPVNFIVWILDNMQKLLKKEKGEHKKQLITSLFQGSLKSSYIKGIKKSSEYESIPTKVDNKMFTILRLQFPERGVFNKVQNQVDINSMMAYYLGAKGKTQGEGLLYMKIVHFPEYLILVFKRFYSNEYSMEKDPSQVLYSGSLTIEENKYKLIGQICHSGSYENGSYKAFVEMGEKWFEAEDLLINEVLKKQMLLGEPYLQVYKRVQKHYMEKYEQA